MDFRRYVMKSEMQALLAEERANKPTQEELLEGQRKELKASTPVTQVRVPTYKCFKRTFYRIQNKTSLGLSCGCLWYWVLLTSRSCVLALQAPSLWTCVVIFCCRHGF